MQNIPCPFCGLRNEVEFKYAGPSNHTRPTPAEEVSDEAWAEYLFMRDNKMGYTVERWAHVHGCSQYFNLVRHTVSHDILGSYKMGENMPEDLLNQLRDTEKKVG